MASKTANEVAKEKDKTKNEPKGFTFFFGFNLERRSHDGFPLPHADCG